MAIAAVPPIEWCFWLYIGCLVKAPLIIGCDVTSISQSDLEILTAPEVLAISRDPLGVQGHMVNAIHTIMCSLYSVLLFLCVCA